MALFLYGASTSHTPGVESAADKKSRVVTLSSSAAYLGSLKNFENFLDTLARKKMDMDALYSQRKLVGKSRSKSVFS